MLCDRLTEGVPLLGVADGMFEGRSCDADCPRCDVHPSELDPGHEVLEAFAYAALASERGIGRSVEAVEHELSRFDSFVAQLPQRGRNQQTRQLRDSRL